MKKFLDSVFLVAGFIFAMIIVVGFLSLIADAFLEALFPDVIVHQVEVFNGPAQVVRVLVWNKETQTYEQYPPEWLEGYGGGYEVIWVDPVILYAEGEGVTDDFWPDDEEVFQPLGIEGEEQPYFPWLEEGWPEGETPTVWIGP